MCLASYGCFSRALLEFRFFFAFRRFARFFSGVLHTLQLVSWSSTSLDYSFYGLLRRSRRFPRISPFFGGSVSFGHFLPCWFCAGSVTSHVPSLYQLEWILRESKSGHCNRIASFGGASHLVVFQCRVLTSSKLLVTFFFFDSIASSSDCWLSVTVVFLCMLLSLNSFLFCTVQLA